MMKNQRDSSLSNGQKFSNMGQPAGGANMKTTFYGGGNYQEGGG